MSNNVYVNAAKTVRRNGPSEEFIEVYDNEADGRVEVEGPLAEDDLGLFRQLVVNLPGCVGGDGNDAWDIMEAARDNRTPVHINGSSYDWSVLDPIWSGKDDQDD